MFCRWKDAMASIYRVRGRAIWIWICSKPILNETRRRSQSSAFFICDFWSQSSVAFRPLSREIFGEFENSKRLELGRNSR